MSKVTTHALKPGDRFGRGVVLEEIRIPVTRADRTSVRGARLLCDSRFGGCGTLYEAPLGDLMKKVGSTKSCGCLIREGNHTTHGLSRHAGQADPLYKTWSHMMGRCYNPRVREYRWYGARGIQVCDRWHDVRLFIEDIERLIGSRPDGYSLDRYPDNDGNYEEGNVRWANDVEQRQNSRGFIDGRTQHPMYATWGNLTRRGSLCERWQDFWIFVHDVEMELGARPAGLCFRRIDSFGIFEPGNVCWGKHPGKQRIKVEH